MKIAYDPEVDALSITFRETTVTTKHLDEGIASDFDADGRLAGIEILDAMERVGGIGMSPANHSGRNRSCNACE
jgi:uncharacterized protein YuzE